MSMFTKSYRMKRIKTKRLRPSGDGSAEVTDRQQRVPGWNQEALEEATVVLIGAGGLGGEMGRGLARKGIGCLKIFDRDVVDRSNLNRQLFYKNDVGKSKGPRLAVRLGKEAFCGTTFFGYDLFFQDAVALDIDLSCTLFFCGVDNNRTRKDVSLYYQELGIPGVFAAVDRVAENGYVLVQEAGKACFGCAFPKSLNGHKMPCRTPAVIDILETVIGIALYAADSLIMDRKRGWNYRNVHLAGFAPSNVLTIEKNPNCPLCGGR